LNSGVGFLNGCSGDQKITVQKILTRSSKPCKNIALLTENFGGTADFRGISRTTPNWSLHRHRSSLRTQALRRIKNRWGKHPMAPRWNSALNYRMKEQLPFHRPRPIATPASLFNKSRMEIHWETAVAATIGIKHRPVGMTSEVSWIPSKPYGRVGYCARLALHGATVFISGTEGQAA